MIKQHLISYLAAGLLALGTLVSCSVEQEQPEETTTESAVSGPSTNALTWHLISRENCFDVWGMACNGTHPIGPRCSTAVAGQPCTTPIASCYKVASPWFTEFDCS